LNYAKLKTLVGSVIFCFKGVFMSLFSHYAKRYVAHQEEEYTLEEYLQLCKKDKSVYASAAERMLMAIGEPELVDTSRDSRLSRIFSNKIIKRYPEFNEFYGMEEAVEQIVSFYKHAAQGLEEKKQILYLLGPVGGGKSSLAEKLKSLIQKEPFYAIKGSPVYESPLGLFAPEEDAKILEEEYGIPPRYLRYIMSPWAVKRLHEFNGDISKFRIVKLWPSINNQMAMTKTEPGDENNQDISALVGKVNISKLEQFPQNDPDAYSYSGGLCKANTGLLEFVEMFKAPIKVLHPLLTATQEGNYNATEGTAQPSLLLAWCWPTPTRPSGRTFRNNKKSNEAFLDRVYIVKVPYCLQCIGRGQEFIEKLLETQLAGRLAPCAPDTLETMLAQFSVLSRMLRNRRTPVTLLQNARLRRCRTSRIPIRKPNRIQEYHGRCRCRRGHGQDYQPVLHSRYCPRYFNFEANRGRRQPGALMLYVLRKADSSRSNIPQEAQ
jgi:serine protein kinase